MDGPNHYDVRTGRWTAPDPIGENGGDPDWYGYCLDDPVNTYNPKGLKGTTLDGVTYDENGMPIDEIGLADPDIDPVLDLIPAFPIGKAITKAGRGVYRIYTTGKEFKFGNNWRVVPLGNRSGKRWENCPTTTVGGLTPKREKPKTDNELEDTDPEKAGRTTSPTKTDSRLITGGGMAAPLE